MRIPATAKSYVRRGLGRGTALTTVMVIAAFGALPAYAQTGTSGGDNAEIVVTASGYAQSVLDVPYNISAVDGSELAERGVTDLHGLSKMVPGLVYADTGPRGGLASGIIIRGLSIAAGGASTRENITEPTVSTYINSTPVFANLFLSDLDRVEVRHARAISRKADAAARAKLKTPTMAEISNIMPGRRK